MTKRKRRRKDGIDYASEIPFQRVAPAGFFDTVRLTTAAIACPPRHTLNALAHVLLHHLQTSDDVRMSAERTAASQHFSVTMLHDVANVSALAPCLTSPCSANSHLPYPVARRQEHNAAQVSAERARDKARIKKLTAAHLPDVLAAEAARDPMAHRKRARLALPAPTVTEADIEALMKSEGGSGASELLQAEAAESGSVVTAGLLSDYGGSGSMAGGGGGVASVFAALRANRASAPVASSRDAIREEALNLIALTTSQTPLLGGDNAPLAPGMGYEGATPSLRRPAPDSTPLLHDHGGSGASVAGMSTSKSAASGGVGGAGRIRDALRLNSVEGDSESDLYGGGASEVGDSASVTADARQRAKALQVSLDAGTRLQLWQAASRRWLWLFSCVGVLDETSDCSEARR